MYDLNNLVEAERLLRSALKSNPNHFRARILLGRVLLARGDTFAAVEVLEPAYEFDRSSAKSELIAALLALAEGQNEAEQLQTCERVLKIDPMQSVALEKTQSILIMQRKREMNRLLTIARKYEEAEDWQAAIKIYERLLDDFPDEKNWQRWLKSARVQAKLAEDYNQAINALHKGDLGLARRLLRHVISTEPEYKDAADYLREAYSTKNKQVGILQRAFNRITTQRGRTN
jgi:tetratricopeptide (TPR) repeat protein